MWTSQRRRSAGIQQKATQQKTLTPLAQSVATSPFVALYVPAPWLELSGGKVVRSQVTVLDVPRASVQNVAKLVTFVTPAPYTTSPRAP